MPMRMVLGLLAGATRKTTVLMVSVLAVKNCDTAAPSGVSSPNWGAWVQVVVAPGAWFGLGRGR
jgi:hypothetical protein